MISFWRPTGANGPYLTNFRHVQRVDHRARLSFLGLTPSTRTHTKAFSRSSIELDYRWKAVEGRSSDRLAGCHDGMHHSPQ